MFMLLCASKFATAEIECSFEKGNLAPLGGTIYFAVDGASKIVCDLFFFFLGINTLALVYLYDMYIIIMVNGLSLEVKYFSSTQNIRLVLSSNIPNLNTPIEEFAKRIFTSFSLLLFTTSTNLFKDIFFFLKYEMDPLNELPTP